MITTPSSFTLDYLSSLKFKELQKLSVYFNVNKRWAKKQELIENLLALKERNKTVDSREQDDEKEWKDGSVVFYNMKQSNECEVNRRLTFNVSKKSDAKDNNSHLTFDVSQNGKILLDEVAFSRETYEIPPREFDLGVEPLMESRATFDIPPKSKLINEVDSTTTHNVYENNKKFLDENKLDLKKPYSNEKCTDIDAKEICNSGFKKDLEKTKFDLIIKNGKQKGEKEKPQVKMLTIPCARVSKRNGLNGLKMDISPIKMSKKSINIKRSTRWSTRGQTSKTNIIKSPAFSSVKKPVKKQTIAQSEKIIQSKVPVRLQFKDGWQKLPEKEDESNKENEKKISKGNISATGNEVLKTKLNVTKVNLKPLDLKSSNIASLKRTLPRKNWEMKVNLNATLGKQTLKPITSTKMPDFSKIHKQHFDQMDSLHDYLRKKEERVKKLFGTPQPGPGHQLRAINKSAPVFHFQSVTVDQKNKGNETSKILTTPLKIKENNSKTIQEAFMNKLPPSKLGTDIKNKNRIHIHGVRSNKRFELQMKFRNM